MKQRRSGSTPPLMTIGTLAKHCGVHVETIRYYQRRRLIQEPPRPPQGVRRYPSDVIDRLHFIKRAQALGFSLNEIEELLTLGSHACEETRQHAQRKRADIMTRIRGLTTMRQMLERLICQCEQGHEDICPLYTSLAKASQDIDKTDKTTLRSD